MSRSSRRNRTSNDYYQESPAKIRRTNDETYLLGLAEKHVSRVEEDYTHVAYLVEPTSIAMDDPYMRRSTRNTSIRQNVVNKWRSIRNINQQEKGLTPLMRFHLNHGHTYPWLLPSTLRSVKICGYNLSLPDVAEGLNARYNIALPLPNKLIHSPSFTLQFDCPEFIEGSYAFSIEVARQSRSAWGSPTHQHQQQQEQQPNYNRCPPPSSVTSNYQTSALAEKVRESAIASNHPPPPALPGKGLDADGAVLPKSYRELPLRSIAVVKNDIRRALRVNTSGSGRNSEIQTVSLALSLLCPLALRRMKVPGRSTTCNHLQCFDVQFYLQLCHSSKNKNAHKCPVCQLGITRQSLIVDEYMMEIVKESPADKIDLDQEGGWKPVTCDPGNKKPKRKRQESRVSVEDLVGGDDGGRKKSSSQEEGEVEGEEKRKKRQSMTIDLTCTDDDDDAGSTTEDDEKKNSSSDEECDCPNCKPPPVKMIERAGGVIDLTCDSE